MKERKTLQEQLRTLDEASALPPVPSSGPYPIVSAPRSQYRLPTGYWCMDLDRPPNRLRRFLAWVLLGYFWHPYRD